MTAEGVATYKGKTFADCTDDELMTVMKCLLRMAKLTGESHKTDMSMAKVFQDYGMADEAIKLAVNETAKLKDIGEQLRAELEKRLTDQ